MFYWNSSRFRSFPVSKFKFLFRFSFLDHHNSSSSSLKTTTDNSSSRFNFRNENYTDCRGLLQWCQWCKLDQILKTIWDQDQNNKTKTTGSKQMHLADLTVK